MALARIQLNTSTNASGLLVLMASQNLYQNYMRNFPTSKVELFIHLKWDKSLMLSKGNTF